MKIKEIFLAAAMAVLVATGASYAGHGENRAVVTITEGEETSLRASSFCKSKEIAIAIIEDGEKNGFLSSVNLYKKYVNEEECATYYAPVLFTPIRLILQLGHSLVAEVVSSDSGKTIYLVSPNILYEVTGEPV